jgi:hypothetical protein
MGVKKEEKEIIKMLDMAFLLKNDFFNKRAYIFFVKIFQKSVSKSCNFK